jgi:hypothetical protein
MLVFLFIFDVLSSPQEFPYDRHIPGRQENEAKYNTKRGKTVEEDREHVDAAAGAA